MSLKSSELLHAPSSHSRLNVPEKPPQESPAEQAKRRELSTQNLICGSARARFCPCHPAQHRYLVFSSRFLALLPTEVPLGTGVCPTNPSSEHTPGMRWSKWDKHNWKICCAARPGDSNSFSLITCDCFLARAQPARAVRFYKHSHRH